MLAKPGCMSDQTHGVPNESQVRAPERIHLGQSKSIKPPTCFYWFFFSIKLAVSFYLNPQGTPFTLAQCTFLTLMHAFLCGNKLVECVNIYEMPWNLRRSNCILPSGEGISSCLHGAAPGAHGHELPGHCHGHHLGSETRVAAVEGWPLMPGYMAGPNAKPPSRQLFQINMHQAIVR